MLFNWESTTVSINSRNYTYWVGNIWTLLNLDLLLNLAARWQRRMLWREKIKSAGSRGNRECGERRMRRTRLLLCSWYPRGGGGCTRTIFSGTTNSTRLPWLCSCVFTKTWDANTRCWSEANCSWWPERPQCPVRHIIYKVQVIQKIPGACEEPQNAEPSGLPSADPAVVADGCAAVTMFLHCFFRWVPLINFWLCGLIQRLCLQSATR